VSATQQTLAQLVKSKYPGAYDDMDDSSLEQSVLAKHPEYSDLPRTQAQKPQTQESPVLKNVPSATGIGPQPSTFSNFLSRMVPHSLSDVGLPLNALGGAIADKLRQQPAKVPGTSTSVGQATQNAGDFADIAGTEASVLSLPAAGEDAVSAVRGLRNGGAADALAAGKNKLASWMRKPATAAQSQAGVPGTVRQIPFMPRVAQPNIPEALVPKGELGTPTNPGPFNKIPSRVSADMRGDPIEAAENARLGPNAPAAQATAPPKGQVIRLPEPNQAVPPINPKYMASVPRRQLVGLGKSGTPGAGTQLQQIGNKVIYTPPEGYPGPRPSVQPDVQPDVLQGKMPWETQGTTATTPAPWEQPAEQAPMSDREADDIRLTMREQHLQSEIGKFDRRAPGASTAPRKPRPGQNPLPWEGQQ
jgi:hypothetical protein